MYFQGVNAVSSAIKQALNNLDKVIDKLEGGMNKRPARPRNHGNQADLFAPPPANVVGFDRTALTKKLDITIARVEELLSEA